jgi:NAD-dependent deacetylase
MIPVTDEHYQMRTIPLCASCEYPLKPNVVLFGEPVRSLAEIETHMADCDLLLVIGTSAQVYPAAGLPLMVKQRGGKIFEFNREPSLGFDPLSGTSSITDFFFNGDVAQTLPLLTRTVLHGAP